MVKKPEINKEYILKSISGNLEATVKLVEESRGSYLFRNIKGAEELERKNHLPISLLSEDELDCFYLEVSWFPDKFTLEDKVEENIKEKSSLSSWFDDYKMGKFRN